MRRRIGAWKADEKVSACHCALDVHFAEQHLRHIDFSMHRVRMLIHFGIIPYIVFDGDYLPSKAKTEVERAKRREESKQKGLELYRLNKPSQAHLEFQKAVDVTPEMARQLIEELKKIGVQYVVAPYEADAQLVYLERKGLIQGMISEDSDLLVFGAKCLLTKLDQYGECVEVNRSDFTSCREISMFGWTDAEFRRMAILSGCDYLTNINRMGLKSAYRFVRKYKNIEKIIRMIQFDGQYHVPDGYLEAFHRAEMTFLYQRVFCPVEQQVIAMSEPEVGVDLDKLPFLGEKMESNIAIEVAKGNLDPMTKTPIVVLDISIEASPKTPWTATKHSHTPYQTLSGKESKSIEQFFKPSRTPLAELDPNSFTPSPSQAQVLRRTSGTTWESSPARTETPTQTLRSLAQPVTSLRDRSHFSNTGSARPPPSISGLPKKRRLDTESSLKEILQNPDLIEGSRSRFFTSENGARGGASSKKKKGSRKKPTDFTVWSDDSTEGAMLELVSNVMPPEVNQDCNARKEEVGSVGVERLEDKPMEREETREETQSTLQSRDSVLSETSTSTAATSVEDSSSSMTPKFQQNVDAELSTLTSKYSYGSEPSPAEVPTEKVQASADPRDRLANSHKSLLPRPCSKGALQRLGAQALHRSKSSIASLNSQAAAPKPLNTNADRTAKEKRRPAILHSHSIGPDASFFKGSEDSLIPHSESEEGEVEEGVSDSVTEEIEDTPPKKSNVNLGKFSFTGYVSP